VALNPEGSAWDALRARVHGDHDLAARLRAVPPDQFPRALAAIADSAGLPLDEETIRRAIAAEEHAWRLRWLP
jgi:hypothetical protein